jgi:hypothetical protein
VTSAKDLVPPPGRGKPRFPSEGKLLKPLAVLPLAACQLLFLLLAAAPMAFGSAHLGDWLVLAAAVLLPAGILITLRRRKVGPRWQITIGYFAAAPVLAFLAVDDPALLRPVTLSDIAPAFPGAEESFDVLMRYGRSQPLGRDFKAPQRIFRQGPYTDPGKPEAWAKWLAGHRADIEADWAELAPVRAWWDELSAFERLGDLTPGRIDAEVMAFAPARSYSQHAVAIAGLRALDGHGDEAFATLQPLLEVSRKLEPSSRTLVRFMIARVIQRMAIEAATFVLDHTHVSPAARLRFAAALAGGSGGEAGARRLIGIEYAFGLEAHHGLQIGNFIELYTTRAFPAGDFRRGLPYGALNFLRALVFNPNRTFNLIGDLTRRRQDAAAVRQTERIGEIDRAFFANEGRPRFKNLAGSAFIIQSTPNLTKVAESYWRIEDLRTALHRRLSET